MSDKTMSPDGVRKLVLREGLKLKAYQDEAGIWTIGVGHTLTARPGMEITTDEAVTLLKSDLRPREKAVNRHVQVALNQSQFDCLVSFVFNIGAPSFRSSTLLRMLNAGDYDAVPAQLLRWDKVTDMHTKKKRRSDGLVYRRVAEAAQWYANRIDKEYSTDEDNLMEIIV